MYRGIITISFCLLTLSAKSQQAYTANEIETKSYQWFVEEKWDSVIHIINYAHKQGIDYYYLQARLGTAWMAKGKYIKAEKAFVAALKFDNTSEYAQENLYYCLLYMGQVDPARKVASKFKSSLNTKIGVKPVRGLDFVLLDGGQKFSTDDPPIGNIKYGGLTLSHKLGHSFSIIHNASFLTQDKYNATLNQFSYTILPRLQISRTVSATAGIYYLNQTFSDSTYNDWAIATSVRKRVGSLDILPLLFSYSSLNEETQMQLGVALGYYPLGNPNLYGQTMLSYHFTPDRKYPVIKQNITAKIFKYLWLTGEFVYDDEIVRFFGETPLTVNNSTDINNFQYSIIGTVPISKKISVYGLFMKENKNLEDLPLTYKFNTFITGLKYTL